MKKIYLHVGPYKTGTTALQTFFYINRNNFESQGIVYPLEYSRAYDKEQGLLDGNIGLLCNTKKFSDEEIAKKIIELVDRYGCILLSNETLFFHMITFERCNWLQRIRELCDDIEIVVIVYLRKQCDYIESFYNHRVKWQKITDDIQKWYQSSKMEQLLDYQNNLSFLDNIIGRKNICVRVYEKEQFVGGNIYSDFLAALSLDENKLYKYPAKKINQSFDNASFQVKRIINGANVTQKNIQKVFFDAALDNITTDDGDFSRNFVLNYDEKQLFMRQWEEGNHYIARRYLGREKLFLSEIKQDNPFIATDREVLERGFQVLSTALVYTNKELQKIKYEKLIDDLFYHISDIVLKNWENIIIYGAGNAGKYLAQILQRKYRKQNLIFAQTVVQDRRDIEGISVQEINSLKGEMETSLVVVATTKSSIHKEMVNALEKLQCTHYVTLL